MTKTITHLEPQLPPKAPEPANLEQMGKPTWMLVCRTRERRHPKIYKATWAMPAGHGVLVRVSKQRRTWWGGWVTAETMVFVPNAVAVANGDSTVRVEFKA